MLIHDAHQYAPMQYIRCVEGEFLVFIDALSSALWSPGLLTEQMNHLEGGSLTPWGPGCA